MVTSRDGRSLAFVLGPKSWPLPLVDPRKRGPSPFAPASYFFDPCGKGDWPTYGVGRFNDIVQAPKSYASP